MSSPSPFAELICRVFRPGERGVIGLVDDLLALASEQELHLTLQAGECRARRLGVDPEEVVAVAVPSSAFRAILARLAALCTERAPGSVSPHRGEGQLSTAIAATGIVRVTFVNTPEEQWVRLTHVARDMKPGEIHQNDNATEVPPELKAEFDAWHQASAEALASVEKLAADHDA